MLRYTSEVSFAKEGARLVVSGRRVEEGQTLVAELRKLGSEADFLRSDVRHEDDVRNLVDEAVKRFGRLDVAVNNAGTEGNPGPVTDQTPETYAATFDRPEEIADTIVFVASQKASFITGASIAVNGGKSAL